MVILFDGVCNMCNTFVQFVIKSDKNKQFQFASLQSPYGKELAKYFALDTAKFDTVLLYSDKNILTRSDATITILSSLGGIWKVAIIFKFLPGFIRDGVYNFLAKRRYKLFGKRDTCMIPNKDISNRFLDNKVFTLNS
jgi:predicted DCC family thiol-disulfide oxidoreductase YuxK